MAMEKQKKQRKATGSIGHKAEGSGQTARKKGAKSPKDLSLEIEELGSRLRESEELLTAIQKGEVDAIVVSSPLGEQIYSLSSSETPYRFFIEEMNQDKKERRCPHCGKKLEGE